MSQEAFRGVYYVIWWWRWVGRNCVGRVDFFTQIRAKNGHTLAVIKHRTRNISNSDMAQTT